MASSGPRELCGGHTRPQGKAAHPARQNRPAAGGRLRPVSDATTVRVRGGEVLISDGPFAETKEQIAGFNVLERADLDEAIEIASRHPTAKLGTFELRPFWES